jgi:recombination protein RecA
MKGNMMASLGDAGDLYSSKAYIKKVQPEKGATLSRAELSGRLVEFSGQGSLANLTLACGLILDAQREGETTAWISQKESIFYPPDVAQMGIDLSALVVLLCPDKGDLARVADRLARSGAFGLLILDLGARGDIPLPQQSRLAGLARKHDMAIVFLTEKSEHLPSMGSLVSLRGKTWSQREADGRFTCSFEAIKDKRRGPGWTWMVAYHGTPGMR